LCETTGVLKQRKNAEGNILTLKGLQMKRWILHSKELCGLFRPDSIFKVCEIKECCSELDMKIRWGDKE
jgi:hypothetical protein